MHTLYVQMPTVRYHRKLRSSQSLSEAGEQEGQERVTLLLGTDTIEKLKDMAVAGRYRGIGRTIDALVDAVTDSKSNIDALIRSSIAATLLQQANLPDREQRHAQLLLTFSVSSAVLAERLNKFIGLRPDQIAADVQKQIKGWPTIAPQQQNGKSSSGGG